MGTTRKLDSLPGRVLRQPEMQPANEKEQSRGRKIFPSDQSRRERTVTVVLPEKEMVDFLKTEATHLSEQRQADGQEGMTYTRLATLLLVAALEQWHNGKLEITNVSKSTELETIEERIVQREG